VLEGDIGVGVLSMNLLLGLAALVAFGLAVWRHRSPRAIMLALLGLLAVSYVHMDGFNLDIHYPILRFLESSVRLHSEIGAFVLLGVWAAAFVGMALFAPKAAISRVILYFLLVLGVVIFVEAWAYRFEGERFPWEPPSSWLLYAGFTSIHEVTVTAMCITWIAISLPLAHGKLFGPPRTLKSGAPADVFISYKRDDRPQVEGIAAALRGLGLNVWFDERLSPGKSFDEEINHHARAAKVVLVCWSPGAAASEWVRAEASIGRQRGVLTACFLAPCELFPPFNLVHAEDLSSGRFEPSNPAWSKLLERIGQLTGRPIPGSSAATAPPAAQGAPA
jgi:hypothetical protein